MQTIECAIIRPAKEVTVNYALRGQFFRKCPLLATSAQDVHQAIQNGPNIDRALVATTLSRRDKWLKHRPFRVREVTRTPQAVTIVAVAISFGHIWLLLRIGPDR